MTAIKIDFLFDFETRSRLTLAQVGAVRYASDPSTEPTLLTYCFGRHSPIKVWRRGQPIPGDIYDVAVNPSKYNIVAFNVLFDYLIWTGPFFKLISGPARTPSIEDLTDAMALTNHYRVGSSLDNAAQVLNLGYYKDPEGRKMMLKQCKPNKHGEFVELTEEEWLKFENYGIVDTKLLRDVYYLCPPLPPQERWAWEWTFKRNITGIRIDMELVQSLKASLDFELPKLEREFEAITKCKVRSAVKVKKYFEQFYGALKDMREDTVRDLLISETVVPPHVRRALEIKAVAGSSSTAKIDKALMIQVNERIYEVLSYHKTQTKRWAGQGIQIQNFPRFNDKHKDLDGFDFNVEHLAAQFIHHYPRYKDPILVLKNLLRRIWIPDEGLHFYCGDFAKIEPTVLFWLTGIGEIPDKWYEEMAAEIFGCLISEVGKDSEERQIGKATGLGSGYGMGWKKFRDDVYKKTGLLISVDLAKRCINAYRRKYYQVTRLWKDLEMAFRAAIYGQTTALCNGKIHVMPMTERQGVKIRIPSGSYLYYHGAHERGKDLAYLADEKGQIQPKHLYGGLLTEHVTSSTARDILLPAMYHLESAHFDVLNLVHDESWAQAEPGREEEFRALMCRNPSWCPDLKIDVGMDNGVRYLK